MTRSLSELRIRVTSHFAATEHSVEINNDFIRDVADGKISPSSAFKLAYKIMGCLGCAKAIRWLAIIARDYGHEAANEVADLI